MEDVEAALNLAFNADTKQKVPEAPTSARGKVKVQIPDSSDKSDEQSS